MGLKMPKIPTYEELEQKVKKLKEEVYVIKASRENDFRLKLFSESAFEGIGIHENGILIDANRQYFNMFGYERNELIGKQVIPLTVAPESIETLKKQIDKKATGSYEAIGLCKDGSRFPIEINVRYIQYKDRMLRVGVIRDITERKQSEDELRLILDATTDGIWRWNFKTNAMFFSPKYYKMLGFEPNEFPSDYNNWLNLIHPDDREKAVAVATEYLKTKPDLYENEFRLRAKNGDYRWIRARAHVVERTKSGDAVYMIGNHEDITNRKRAEEALINERDLFERTMETSPAGIVRVNADGVVVYANKLAEKLLGIELQGTKWRTYNDPAWKITDFEGEPFPEKKLPFAMVKQTGKPVFNVQHAIEWPDGKRRLLSINAAPLMNSENQFDGIVVAIEDITERKQAEETLKERTQTLNEILEKAADGICVYHKTSEYPFVKFSHWNPRMTEITGYTIEEINRSGWYQSLYPDPEIQQRAVERMTSMRQEDDIKAEEWVITTKDQKKRALSMSTSVLKEDDGVIHVLAMMQDVSERKEYLDQLVVSRKEWEDIFQAIGHPTIILDPKHGIIKANKAALNLTGLTENQLKGRKCFDVFHTSNKPPGSCPMEALLHTGSLETVEMVMEALDGTFLVSCTPISDKDGNIEKIIHIATDITESKKLELELRHAHKVEALGTLSGGIAHEFNNILGIIIGNTELAIDDVPEWNPAKDCLEEIRTASLRAKDVVRQIMSFSRKTPATRKPIQISTIIQESLKLMRATIPTNIEIRQEILCNDEMILANPTEINQILMNLCSNSVHAMEGETGVLKVRLETTVLDDHSAAQYNGLTSGEYVKLTVKDNGSGIDPKIIGLIFDPYFTTKDVDKGLGMGLAVVYGIVKKHDGAIRVNSKVGKGTTVEVLFPITKETAQIEKEVSKELAKGQGADSVCR